MLAGLAFAIGGLVVLAIASDQFVKGSVRLAVVLKISPIVVGSLVVGFGTSAPEMVVSAVAALDGNLEIGVGNVIGSNVANVSLVLGCAALVAAVPVQASTIRGVLPISVVSVVVFAGLLQGSFNRIDGAILAALLVVALWLLLRRSRVVGGDQPSDLSEFVGGSAPAAANEILRTALGLAFVVGSAWAVVEGAEQIADELDLSGGFVGFTLVAIGTSAPELFTAVAAARRNAIDLLIGNLLGSNMFNSLAVGAAIALAGPGKVEDGFLAVAGSAMMVAVVMLSAAIMISKRRVNRQEGAVLLLVWIACVVGLASS